MTRYVLGERIGIGGMAEIFRGTATAPGGFEKPVAIKRILPHLSQDERFVNLLIKEANVLSQLRHRNIVQIFDVGLGTDGQYFLVMEYVDGADLNTLFDSLQKRKKRLPVDIALHIAAEVCEALHFAHRAKSSDGKPLDLVHRDVSPANILLSRSGEVKLTDFGIAKQREEATGHGAVRGKFAYISPEQAANEHVDGRSDVYSVGVVLYELVLGHRLYSHMPDFDALHAVRSGSIRRPREVDPKISPELEETLLRALSRQPDQRFATASDFGSQLRGLRYSMPTTGVDPAKEIARVLDKYANASAAERMVEREPTVVRIRTAAGFGMTAFDSSVTDSAPFDGAAAAFDAFDAFDDEQTRSLDPAERAAMVKKHLGGRDSDEVATVQVDTLSQAQLAEAERKEAARARLAVVPQTERAATPTVKDQFHAHELMREPPPPASNPPSQTLYTEAHRRRRRALLYLILAAVAVAALSFVVAGTLISSGKAASSATDDAAAPDAGPVDASPPADAAPPDAKPKSKKRKSKKRRGKSKRPRPR